MDEQPTDWRARYIELAEDLCRECGQPLPTIIDASAERLRFGLEAEGMRFDLLHFADAADRMIVQAKLDRGGGSGNDAGFEVHRLDAALIVNGALAQSHLGMLAIEGDDDLVYVTAQSLHELSAEGLIAEMRAWALEWRA
ncbi:MAG: hypothetical protein EOO22_08205 [Comamonadaceae bacterium]|nr:MAG: hypothetical protein EOO22_08205 [Comamonadaceae bacterium]